VPCVFILILQRNEIQKSTQLVNKLIHEFDEIVYSNFAEK
jgi:hypothetical protein